jgi:hypothetical protein
MMRGRGWTIHAGQSSLMPVEAEPATPATSWRRCSKKLRLRRRSCFLLLARKCCQTRPLCILLPKQCIPRNGALLTQWHRENVLLCLRRRQHRWRRHANGEDRQGGRRHGGTQEQGSDSPDSARAICTSGCKQRLRISARVRHCKAQNPILRLP